MFMQEYVHADSLAFFFLIPGTFPMVVTVLWIVCHGLPSPFLAAGRSKLDFLLQLIHTAQSFI